MANSWYVKGRAAYGRGEIAWKASGGSDIRIVLLDTTLYTVNLATDEFLSDVASGARAAVSSAITLIDAADDGILDAADYSFTGLTGMPTIPAILLYKHTGTASTSPLLLYMDTSADLPIPAGRADIDVLWSNAADKMARL